MTSEDRGQINSNLMVVKLKLKSPTQKLKKFDSWPKLNSKGKWNVNLT